MKDIHFTKQRFASLLSGLVLLAAMTTGCIHESLDACPPIPPATTHSLVLKVVNAEGDEITGASEERFKDVSLYVFDDQKNFIDIQKITSSQIVERFNSDQQECRLLLDYPDQPGNLYVVAWGGLNADSTVVPQMTNASQAEDLNIMVKSADDVADAPNQMFFGNLTAKRVENAQAEDQEIVIAPKIGRMRIEAYGLEYVGLKSAGMSDDQFDYTIRETQSGFDHTGALIGENVHYLPPAEFTSVGDSSDVFVAPAYNTIPRKDGKMSVVLHGKGVASTLGLRAGTDDFSYTATEDSYGNPIAVSEDKQTLVVFRFQHKDDPVPDPDPEDPSNPEDPGNPGNPETPDPDPIPGTNIVVYVSVKQVDWNYVHEDHVVSGGEEILKSSRNHKK